MKLEVQMTFAADISKAVANSKALESRAESVNGPGTAIQARAWYRDVYMYF